LIVYSVKQIILGKYVREADIRKAKEERKIIAGYASGRKAPEVFLFFSTFLLGLLLIMHFEPIAGSRQHR
jgi:hypothetical protein